MLVKAAAGGGGKGMRIVRSAEEYDAAVASAQREARSAFGDDTILIEKYVEHGRHIEVQILADAHGNVVHSSSATAPPSAATRRCWRRPPRPPSPRRSARSSPTSAVALAREVGYENAGTVEFLLDTATGEAYFLEMNTRLQVEHPVTELRDRAWTWSSSSCGSPPARSCRSPRPRSASTGHAIEARVYAEDSFNGFLPQAGTATFVRWAESPIAPASTRPSRAGRS